MEHSYIWWEIINRRWDTKFGDGLPECMKHALGKIFDSYEAMDHELARDEKYSMAYLKNFVCYYNSLLTIKSIYTSSTKSYTKNVYFDIMIYIYIYVNFLMY